MACSLDAFGDWPETVGGLLVKLLLTEGGLCAAIFVTVARLSAAAPAVGVARIELAQRKGAHDRQYECDGEKGKLRLPGGRVPEPGDHEAERQTDQEDQSALFLAATILICGVLHHATMISRRES